MERNGVVFVLACCGLVASPWLRAVRSDPTYATTDSEPVSTPLCIATDGVTAEEFANRALRELPHEGVVPTVLVTVPDPLLTRLSLTFDEALDAMASGMAQSGFVPDRYWLPWQPDKPASKPSCALALAPAKPDPTREPGVLFFRRVDDARSLLAVLLVGEAPTRGVHLDALHDALHIAASLSGDQVAHVLGPTFSGSAPSLFTALQLWAPKASVITGTATASIDTSQLRFRRTVVEDFAMKSFVLRELQRFTGGDSVALLSESGTAYGSGLEINMHAASDSRDPTIPLSMNRDTPSSPLRPQPLQPYRFPLHIAQVRAAHEEGKPGASSEMPNDLRRTLRLRLDERPTSSDTLPTFSPLTSFQAELNLRNTLRAIASTRVRYLIIAATDTADLLYVIQQARTYCPDIQPIALESNMLLLHPDEASTMAGVLVASSYPLTPLTKAYRSALDVVTHRPSIGSGFSFGSSGAEGIYNALLLHLAELYPRTTNRPPDPAGSASDEHAVQAWLTLIDGSQFWPLRTDHSNRPVPSRRVSVWLWARPTRFALAVSFLVSCWCAVQVWLFVRARRGRNGASGLAQLVQIGRSPEGGLYSAVASLSLAAFGILVSCCAHAVYNFEVIVHEARWLSLANALATCVALPIGSVMLLWFGLESWSGLSSGPDMAPPRRGHCALKLMAMSEALVVSLVLALIARYAWELWCDLHDDTLGPLQWIRLRDPFALSPLSPLFFSFAGLYAWAHSGLARLLRRARFARRGPFSRSLAPPAILRAVQLDLLRGPLFAACTGPIGLLCTGLFALACLLLWRRMLPTFEADGFDVLVKVLWILLSGLVLLACLLSSMLWNLVRDSMAWLVATPMAGAYDRIANKVTLSFGFEFRSQIPTADELVISASSCQLLAQLASNIDSTGQFGRLIKPCAPSLQRIAQRLEECFADRGCDAVEAAARERRIHELFFEASRLLHRTLNELWRARSKQIDMTALKEFIKPEALAPNGDLDRVLGVALLSFGVPLDDQLWIRAAEDFVAMRAVTFVYFLFDHLRSLIRFALLGSLALVCAVFSYPWQPHRFIAIACGTVLTCVVALALRVLVGMERSELLVRLGKSSGRSWLNFGFLNQVATYVVLPVLVLVARVFPELGDRFAVQLEPILSILR